MKKLFIIFCLIISIQSFSQKNENLKKPLENIAEKNLVLSIQLSGPIGISLGANLEARLFDFFTINSTLGVIGMRSNENPLNTPINVDESQNNTVGALNIEPRFYFNLGHRKKMKRNVKNSSGNYIGLRYFVSTPAFLRKESIQFYNFENAQSLQLHIGTKHHLSNRVLIGANIGYALVKGKNITTKKGPDFPTIQVGATLGYVF
jgi:hypothetical protein